MTLNDVLPNFLDHKQTPNGSTVSIAGKLARHFSDKDVSEMRFQDCLDYVLHRRRQKAAASTINREISIMKQFFVYLVRTGVIPASPAAELPIEKHMTVRDRWITPEEEEKLILCAPHWFKPIIKFAAATGMRRGEIMLLTWKDIDITLKIARVRKSKNDKPRNIPLTKRALEALEESRRRQEPGTTWVFTNTRNHALDSQTFDYGFLLIRRAAGIRDLHFHDLRHTFATRLVQRGVDLYVVQRLLGHSNPEMTQRYAHHSVESLRRAVEE